MYVYKCLELLNGYNGAFATNDTNGCAFGNVDSRRADSLPHITVNLYIAVSTSLDGLCYTTCTT